ncbi:MAG: S1 RNA-binding domain-containing protein [Muribaculaceae bacterium]
MIGIGKTNSLEIARRTEQGLYLNDDCGNEVLLPNRYITDDMNIGDTIDVFVYNDSEDRPIATTERPYAQVGEFALLRVKAVNSIGAFLDWGLIKDLLVPFREQKMRMVAGRSYIVYVYVDDESRRIVASAKLDKFLDNKIPEYKFRQKVDILVARRTDLGFKVVVDNLFWGMIYHDEIFHDVNIGERYKAFIKAVRPDGKIDLKLGDREVRRVKSLADVIMEYIDNNGGSMKLTDSSSPEMIRAVFNCSKKDFKKTLGFLYKAKKIVITPQEVRMA